MNKMAIISLFGIILSLNAFVVSIVNNNQALVVFSGLTVILNSTLFFINYRSK